jgi:hypothetical protein
MILPFQQGSDLKKHYIDVIMSKTKGEPMVKFTRVRNSSMFVLPQTDNICKRETEDCSISPRTN